LGGELHVLCHGHAPRLVRLEARQYLVPEAADLLQEHLLRHGAAIQAD